MAPPPDKNDEYFSGSPIFGRHTYVSLCITDFFCGKVKEKLFSKLLKIFRKT